MSNSFEYKPAEQPKVVVNEKPKETVVEMNHAGSIAVVAILTALVLAVVGGWWYQHKQVGAMRNEIAVTHQKMDQMRTEMDQRVAAAKNEVNETVARMNEEVEAARRESKQQVARVQSSTRNQTGKAIKSLSEKNAELSQQLDQVKKDHESTVAGIKSEVGDVKTDVANTKTDVATTRNDLDKTILDLRRAHGDMGVMSGLIATNTTELEALKKIGERDYFEFTLSKKAAVQKVGGVQLALKKADVKRNRFTMDVLADDKKVEKRDKGVNEPVQFYTSSARIPYEVVVNQISKDTVTGYLSVPKVKIMARR